MFIINRPGVAGAVLLTPLLLIKLLIKGTFPPNLHNIITPKPNLFIYQARGV